MGQVNIKSADNFNPTGQEEYGYGFLPNGTPVRINQDGSTTQLSLGNESTPNIIANLGVGLETDRPDISTVEYNDIYVTNDTAKEYTKVDDTTWQTNDLTEGQYITDTKISGAWELYLYDGNEMQTLTTSFVGSGGFDSPNLYVSSVESTINQDFNNLSYVNDVDEADVSGVTSVGSGDVLLDKYLFTSSYSESSIQEGSWIWHYNTMCSSNSGDTRLVFEFGMYNPVDESEIILQSVESEEINNEFTSYTTVFSGYNYTVDPTHIGYIKVYARTTRSVNTTVTYKVGNGYGLFLTAPFSLRHSLTRGRDEENSHPTKAITNLDQMLADRITDAPNDGQTYVRKNGLWGLVESTGGTVVKAKNVMPIRLENLSNAGSTVQPLSKFATTTQNPSPIPSTSPYATWANGGVAPVMLQAGKLVYFALHCTGAAVSTSTVGSAPVARFDIYKNYHSSRILLSTVRVPIQEGIIGVYGNASENTDVKGVLVIDLDTNECDAIGVEFVPETTDNNSINNLQRIEVGMCHEYTESVGDLTYTLLDDTPSSYAGQANKLPRVNDTEVGMEFTGITVDASNNVNIPGNLLFDGTMPSNKVSIDTLKSDLKNTLSTTTNIVDFGVNGYKSYVFTGIGAVVLTDSNRQVNKGGWLRLPNADSVSYPSGWVEQEGSQTFDKTLSNICYDCIEPGKVIYTITNDKV